MKLTTCFQDLYEELNAEIFFINVPIRLNERHSSILYFIAFHEYAYEISAIIKSQDPCFNQFQEQECNFQIQSNNVEAPAFQYLSTLAFIAYFFYAEGSDLRFSKNEIVSPRDSLW